VLIVLIDDAGFGNPDTFGGPIATPNLTRVQQMGLTYNRFHVTAVCSPTRAALLTGRNHHRVGFGSIAEYPGPFPGYTAARPRTCTALPRILKENGYVTGGFGKWHLTPDNVQDPAGPFDHWPQAWGFDHWWGFLSGAAGQYDPIITQDNSTLGVPEGKDGQPYYFPDDLTDKAVEWLHGVRAQDAAKPWFMYYSTGCAHAPHHVAQAWADKYKGRFDGGWDALREQTFERQKRLGIVPEGTELTKRPELFPAWDSLNDAEKRLYARQMEVFAGYSENADWNVGRLLDAIEEMGDLDNTLIFYIWGQRVQHGRHDHRLIQRADLPQRCGARTGAAVAADRAVRRHRGTRWRAHRTALRGCLGACRQRPIPVGQADVQPPRRGPEPDGGRLARPDQGR
jgi:arylsulfatase A-like enzyme